MGRLLRFPCIEAVHLGHGTVEVVIQRSMAAGQGIEFLSVELGDLAARIDLAQQVRLVRGDRGGLRMEAGHIILDACQLFLDPGDCPAMDLEELADAIVSLVLGGETFLQLSIDLFLVRASSRALLFEPGLQLLVVLDTSGQILTGTLVVGALLLKIGANLELCANCWVLVS